MNLAPARRKNIGTRTGRWLAHSWRLNADLLLKSLHEILQDLINDKITHLTEESMYETKREFLSAQHSNIIHILNLRVYGNRNISYEGWEYVEFLRNEIGPAVGQLKEKCNQAYNEDIAQTALDEVRKGMGDEAYISLVP